MHLSGKYSINKVCSRRPVFQFLFFKVAVLYGFDPSQIFTPIILRLYQPHSLCEKGATKAAAKAALYVFLLPPLREGQLEEIAHRFHRTQETVRSHLRRLGVIQARKVGFWKIAEIREAKDMVKNGYSLSEIARKFDRTESSVQSCMNSRRWAKA